MANGTTNSTGFFSKIIAFFTGNPIFAILSSLFLLAFIMPPRSRKYRSKKRTTKRRRKSGNPCKTKNPGNPGKKPKGKKGKSGKKTATRKSSHKLGPRPKKKGPEMNAYMAKMRALVGK